MPSDGSENPSDSELYRNLVASYEEIDGLMPTQFDTVITNKLFTPKNTLPEGDEIAQNLQIRVSKDVVFHTGVHDGSDETDYTFKISENEVGDQAFLETKRQKLALFSKSSLELNNLEVTKNTSTVSCTVTDKVLEIGSTVYTEITGPVKFNHQAQFQENLFMKSGKSLILSGTSAESGTNVQIGLQYNSEHDSLDIVKQQGSKKFLMVRFGGDKPQGLGDTTLKKLPLRDTLTLDGGYSYPPSTSSPFTAVNIWRDDTGGVVFGSSNGEHVGIGVETVTSHKFEVQGNTNINGIIMEINGNMTTVGDINAKEIYGSTSVTTSGIVQGDTGNFTSTIQANKAIVNDIKSTGNIKANTVEANNIEASNVTVTEVLTTKDIKLDGKLSLSSTVNNFTGNLSQLNNDLAPWLDDGYLQTNVRLVDFANNGVNDDGSNTFMTNLQERVIHKRWRFRELDNGDMHLEKLDSDGITWNMKFLFSGDAEPAP